MDSITPSIEAAIERIGTEGFAVIPNLIDEDRLARLSDDSEALLHPIPNQPGLNGARATGRMFKGLFRSSRAFDDIIVHPTILAVVRGVLVASKQTNADYYGGSFRDIQLSTSMIKDVQPGEDIRTLHQDDGFFPIPRPRQPLAVNTLLAIDPFTVANGATRVVPRSHHWSKKLEPDHDFVTVEMDAGSILMFNGAVWHGRGPNRTAGRCRRALNLYYSCSWLRQVDGHYCGLPKAEVDRLPATLKALL
ncbi:MAG: phytanoyl-CoA dioxygenase family protein [Gammaproteobacteria bacterium]|nr:phytanoyl-CoA dioxygenase family protein [Gammaproteobacteria bacterium]MDE0443363.1 phytanoyl-CoA dioxygenase family protein [Gammaproteobacteria bacterium]